MQDNVTLWKVEEMARVLGVSRSGYYHFYHRKISKRQQENEKLQEMIKTIFSRSRRTYGSPRIHAELKAQGVNLSRPRVARLMKQLGLAAKMQSLFKVTTRVNKKQAVAPNLLQQNFTAATPDSKWVADISYIRTLEGWLYIAVILDLYSRKVVGLSMGNSLHTELVTQALEQALQRRNPTHSLQHHSDKGCQYTSAIFQKLLTDNGIICSMSSTGCCFDNAVAESFFHSLKTECVYFERYESREQAKQSIFEYIEVFYNNHRRHSTLGYLSPVQFERRFYQRLAS
ncbi:MAG: IS3 family transposase [Pseudomonadota bacterium]